MPKERIGKGHVLPLSAFAIRGVLSDVQHQQIEQPIMVVIEENSSGGMRGPVDARFARDVAEVSVAVVFEKHIAATHGGNEQIGVSVVIDVSKSGGDADAARHADACFLRDVLEFASAQVLPKLVPAGLADEVDVVQPITVYVRYSDSGSVVIVRRLIVSGRVVDDAIHEGDSALLKLIFELKLIEHLKLIDGFQLLLFSRG